MGSRKSKRKRKSSGSRQTPSRASSKLGRKEGRSRGFWLSRHPRFAMIAVFGAILVVAGVSWYFVRSYSRIEGIRNVLIVSIDTCRADHLSCYGYSRKTTPNIDSLAGDGVLFKSTVTPVPITLPAHCSMLTGTYPPIHGVRLFANKLDDATATLAGIMKSAGYQTAAFIGAFPLESQFGLDRGFETYDDQFPEGRRGGFGNERTAEEVNRPAMKWLETHRDKPFFLFLHYFDAHFPYEPPAPFATDFADDPYAGEIAYVDRCIGQVIDKLKKTGMYDNTLIIITGDHGEGLGDHNELQHGFLIYQSTLEVPLIVRVPKGGVRNIRVDGHVSLVDIVPTVLSLVGLEAPQQVQGIDLRDCLEGSSVPQRKQPIYVESLYPELMNCGALFGAIDGTWKYILAPRPELYDLSLGAEEKVDIISKQPHTAMRLQASLDKMIAGMESASSHKGGDSFDEDSMRRLRSLGYVGGAGQAVSTSEDGANDPKDFVEIFGKIQSAEYLVTSNRFAEAKKECLELISMSPKLYEPRMLLATIDLAAGRVSDAKYQLSAARSILKELIDNPELPPSAAKKYSKAIMTCHTKFGLAYISQGKLDEAVVELKSALHIDPEFFWTVSRLGLVMERLGKLDEAITYYQKALKIEPNNTEICSHLGMILDRRGRVDEAITYYCKALTLQPKLPTIHNDLGRALARRGQFDDAVVHYRKSLQIQPELTSAMNNLAWILATCPKDSIRNGPEAVELAKQVVSHSGKRDPATLDTLAAAYAEAKQFPQAVATAKEAIALAKSAGNTALAKRIESRLELYLAGKAYRESLPEKSPLTAEK
ncbi:MAG: sulfatase-like hydrolase/transferase [Pirellulales bacterium]|nr:sulfatase-like hydrolase/transferase [Pirellulales bacterium]